MKLSERLQFVIDRLPITASAWSLRAGNSRGYVQKLLEREARRPDPDAIDRLADVAGVPRAWLFKGEGPAPKLGGAEGEVRVESDPVSPIAVPDDAGRLVQAVTQAFDKDRHLVTDASTVIDALQHEIDLHQPDDSNLVEKARVWLDAAAALRREKRPITAGTLLDRVTLGRSPAALELPDAFQQEIAEIAKRHGIEFGQALRALAALGKKPPGPS